MKLLRAKFENFRLLRDVELDFSTDAKKNLTVVRAANESGKTTILHALQWALYGDNALPGNGDGFRLHPIDWDINDGKRVPITATIDFEVTTHRQTASGMKESRNTFRLIRSTFEDADAKARRLPSTVKLFELKDHGYSPIESPEAQINDELPPELRDIFFTDGDRALSFIEAEVTVSTKRERVNRAIRALLGLGVIEESLKHVRKAGQDINKQAKQIGGSSELQQITTRLESVNDEIGKHTASLEDAKTQFSNFDERLADIDRRIGESLKRGDKDSLQRQLETAKKEMKRLDEQLQIANKDHGNLFRAQSLSLNLVKEATAKSFALLKKLNDQGKIPNTTVPVLEYRLDSGTCICGETLNDKDEAGRKRRAYIQNVISESRRSSDIQATITDLFYDMKSLSLSNSSLEPSWVDDLKKTEKLRDSLQEMRDDAGKQFRALELQLDSLPDTDISGLRHTQLEYRNQRDTHLANKTAFETKLSTLQRDKQSLEADRNRLLKEIQKGHRMLAEVNVTNDIIRVFENSFNRITNEELQKVSNKMNDIFLEMIGADPEQRSIVKRAEISPEFDIIVFGPNQKTLNPDRDLNGASRRALTLAFVLALTKVSEVEAPNVIDTPLGMTSGYVKRSMLKTIVRESSQLILFLTHSEIADCEDIIDEFAGVVFTITNPAHYPTMLVNDPGIGAITAKRCSCTHREECALCQRRGDAKVMLELVS